MGRGEGGSGEGGIGERRWRGKRGGEGGGEMETEEERGIKNEGE